VLWFGVLGGGLAWVTTFVAGLQFTYAQCNAPSHRWHLPVQTWQWALSAAGVVVGVVATAVCVRIYRRTRDPGHTAADEREGLGHQPPLGRINFLAQTGLLVNVLSVAIMVMTAIGAPLLRVCQQS
jgi:hypothetical protein